MKDITDADCTHAKKVIKHFEIKHLGKYHNLYVQSDTFLLVDVCKNSRNICFDPTHFFFTVSGLAWQAALKRPK